MEKVLNWKHILQDQTLLFAKFANNSKLSCLFLLSSLLKPIEITKHFKCIILRRDEFIIQNSTPSTSDFIIYIYEYINYTDRLIQPWTSTYLEFAQKFPQQTILMRDLCKSDTWSVCWGTWSKGSWFPWKITHKCLTGILGHV